MLDAFARAAERRGLLHQEVLGDWPDVAEQAPHADVVVCHHVAYNVADLAAFAMALDAHARRRIVLEIPRHHPLSDLTPLWRRFWNLDRPDGPTALDALAVLREQGLDAQLAEWDEPTGARGLRPVPFEQQVEFTRIRLCLSADRDPEIAEALAGLPRGPRQLATLWWDVTR